MDVKSGGPAALPGAGGHARADVAGIAAGVGAMAAWAGSGVIAKGLDMGSLAIVLYRMWMYAALVIAVLMLRGGRLTLATMRVSALGGIGFGLDLVLFFSAVKMTTMANATVIGALQPVLMLALAGPLFGERVNRREVGLAALAIGGVALVMFGSSGLPDANPAGDLLAVCALFAWTAYFIFSKRTQAKVSSLEYTAATALWATLFVTPIALVSGQDLSLPVAGDWFWLVMLAVVPGLAGHGLMNWSLTRIPVWLASTLSLAIPVTATLMAWAFIDEPVDALQFVGMGVVLAALAALVSKPGPAAPAAPAAPAPPTTSSPPPPPSPGIEPASA
ncbi:MAG: EamA family transporter [Acidimicrobiia bacterium]|nr:EamA family transporter [Acidimicrobiia bacterium]